MRERLKRSLAPPYSLLMSTTPRKDAEAARNQLPDLLKDAQKGRSTVITNHGRPEAALAPIEVYGSGVRQESLLPLAGSGRGLGGNG